jgi:vesicle coat complex subunit
VGLTHSYATEADIDFVKASVRAIGRCALKVESTVDKCITVLLALLQSRISYVVQEAIIVIRDIFRLYPNKYTSVIVPMCAVMDLLEEPEAKAAMMWVIGEYCDIIDNAAELLDAFLDSFHDEATEVQLELLTAVVKLFLKQPAAGQELVTSVLTMSTEESTNADVRDRGYIYWRLLSADAKLAKQVVLKEKPLITPHLEEMIDDDTLQTLLEEIGLVSSVYHKPGESFITPKVGPAPIDEIGDDGNVDLDEEEEEYEEESEEEEESDIFEEGEKDDGEANFIF